jgi:chromosome segregation ATPase
MLLGTAALSLLFVVIVLGLLLCAENVVRREAQDELEDANAACGRKNLQIIALEERVEELEEINDSNLAASIAAIQHVDAHHQEVERAFCEEHERLLQVNQELGDYARQREREIDHAAVTKADDERVKMFLRHQVVEARLAVAGLMNQRDALEKKVKDLTPKIIPIRDWMRDSVTLDPIPMPAKKKAAKKQPAKKRRRK